MSAIFIINNFVIEQDINSQTVEKSVENYYSQESTTEPEPETVVEPTE